jgi:L-asparaginase
MGVKIFVTGGTFDKIHDEIKEAMVFGETHVPEVLRQGRSKIEVDIRTLMMIDSLQMTDNDRQIILDNCKNAKEEQIVITHGTSTMELTARYIANHITNKTVVLTGAMVPYVFGSSDGLFNLAAALAFAQSMPNGIYIAMNGKCFSWNNVRKNVKTGEFEERLAAQASFIPASQKACQDRASHLHPVILGLSQCFRCLFFSCFTDKTYYCAVAF